MKLYEKYLCEIFVNLNFVQISGKLTNTKNRVVVWCLFVRTQLHPMKTGKDRPLQFLELWIFCTRQCFFSVVHTFFAVRLERAWCIKRGECKRTNSVWLTKSTGTEECPRIFLRRTFRAPSGYRATCFKTYMYVPSI